MFGGLKQLSANEVEVIDDKALVNETQEERWARLDSDAHMSLYLVCGALLQMGHACRSSLLTEMLVCRSMKVCAEP